MVVKSMVSHRNNSLDEILSEDTLIERLRRLRALNRKPEKIGLTEYTWHSFSIERHRNCK